MKSMADPFRQLVSSKLWPVALLLVIAAAAAPMLFGDREPLPPVPAPAATAADSLQAALVTAAATEETGERRRVLGARKDPFTPTGRQPRPPRETRAVDAAPTAAPAAPRASDFTGSRASVGGAPTSSGGSSSPAPSGGSAPAPSVTPIPGPAPAPAPVGGGNGESYALYSLKVNVNDQPRVLKRLDPLPSAENPAVIYLGLLKDGKTAVFLVDSEVKAEGDGSCHPSPEDCQRVHLREGETEFFAVGGTEGELQVDLIDIKSKRTASASAARAAYAQKSESGHDFLRSNFNRVGRLRYDERTGTLRMLSRRAWKASAARAAAR